MDEKPPCDECSSYDFSCTGACEKPMADIFFDYHDGVYTAAVPAATATATAVTVTANTITAAVAWPVAAEEWNWPGMSFRSTHPVLGFVTSRPGALCYRAHEEAPRSRTVMFKDRPLRLYWPRLAFFVQEDGHADADAPLFVFRVDGDAPLAADTPLRQFPFTLWINRLPGRVGSYSHVSQIGAVCFDGEARNIMKSRTRDALDVFWSSGFSKIDDAVLARWRDAPPAEVLRPDFFPDADWSWNKYAPGGLTVGAMLAGTKVTDSRAWTG